MLSPINGIGSRLPYLLSIARTGYKANIISRISPHNINPRLHSAFYNSPAAGTVGRLREKLKKNIAVIGKSRRHIIPESVRFGNFVGNQIVHNPS